MPKYRLELTEAQLRVVNMALEEFFRLPLNQWRDLADRLAMKGVDLSKDNPKHAEIISHMIHNRDDAIEVFQAAGRILWPWGPPKKDDEQMIAEDIWQVIRHQFFLDSGSTDTWRVDAGPVYQWGPEPLPKIEKVDT